MSLMKITDLTTVDVDLVYGTSVTIVDVGCDVQYNRRPAKVQLEIRVRNEPNICITYAADTIEAAKQRASEDVDKLVRGSNGSGH